MKSRIFPALAALGAIAIPVWLGVWQLQRRDWKNSLLTRFETALVKPPAAYNPVQPASPKKREFMRVRVKGEFMSADTARIMSAAPEEQRAQLGEDFGYLLFVPLKFQGGIVFVNRGFVPLSLAGSPDLVPKGETEVTGIVRLSQKPGWLSPPANAAKRQFYVADIPAMADAAGLAGDKAIESEYIQAEPMAGAPRWPEARDPKELLASIPNDHLEYAITWFGLAAAAGVFGFYIVRA
ncbi:MAG: SURF1 family protein [Rhodomicrobium sp.]